MTSRDEPAQGSPGNLAGFPASGCEGSLYRSTLDRYSSFGFYSSVGGRFDLSTPRGTLYLARSAHTAVMERVAAPIAQGATGGPKRNRSLLREGKVGWEQARHILIWEIESREPVRLADLTTRRAADFGVTNELTSTSHYELARQWASAFERAGFGGILYNSRFVTSKADVDSAVGIFGDAGAHDGPFVSVRPARTLVEAASDVGIGIRHTHAHPTALVEDF
ncbi:RES domain-containing protein [Paramicrobacterium humi]|uniref:RES domain-containing protein n=1 Tax=Paramicrobacterium humi TaxID=640635 RepID=A0A1H4NA85_9MICO|nr:RES domain-containing protein [Microbacterium humi]